jgi:hypothetical protein
VRKNTSLSFFKFSKKEKSIIVKNKHVFLPETQKGKKSGNVETSKLVVSGLDGLNNLNLD